MSLIPTRPEDKKNKDEKLVLTAANGSKITTYGCRLLYVKIGFDKALPFVFTVADVTDPLIGIDFLTHHDISIYPRHSQLIHHPSGNIVTTQSKSKPSILPIMCHELNLKPAILELLRKFPELTSEEKCLAPVKHNVVHRTITNGPPIAVRPRRLNPRVRRQAEDILQKLLEDGTIKPSSSPWASPIHLVPKKSASWRLVGDYRLLNRVTKKDSYPLPYLQDFSNELSGKAVFSTVDLKDAYHQIPIHPEDIEKTALSTPYGSFEYTRMSFGLCGAAQTFQRFVDQVFRGLTSKNGRKVKYFCYLDDILLASDNMQEHLEDVEALFKRLNEYGLKINLAKCVFQEKELQFLGHTITAKGISPQNSKVEAIRNFAKPVTLKDLRRYLGMINYYHKFIEKAASTLAPLTALLSATRSTKSNAKLIWNEAADRAFLESKNLLSEATLLSHFDVEAETSVAVDASDYAVAAVLQQKFNDDWKPIAFFSKKLSPAQLKYSTFSKELYGIYAAIKYFKNYLAGGNFHVLTDHKPIIRACAKKTERDFPREERWMEFIHLYTSDLRHIKGTENNVADALTRDLDNALDKNTGDEINDDNDENETNFISALFVEDDSECLINEQSLDSELETILSGRKKITPEIVKVNDLYCHDDKGNLRPFIPVSMRKKIFNDYHLLSHPGAKSSINYLRKKYFWLGMRKDISNWTKTCISCQKSKIIRHNKTGIESIPPASGKFEEIHLDLVGPLPVNKECKYLLTIVDRFSRWTEAIPLKDITTASIVDNFLLHWVARYGIPRTITTDRGAQFESQIWKELLNSLGTKKIRTTAYHPQSNGLVERFNKRLKEALRAHADLNGSTWLEKLPHIMLAIRTAVRDDTMVSPAQILYGMEPTLPSDLLMPYERREDINVGDYTKDLKRAMRFVDGVKSRPAPLSSRLDKSLSNATHVFVRNNARRGLEPNYRGPYKVIEKHNKFFVLEMPSGLDTVSIDRLKVCYLAEDYLYTPSKNAEEKSTNVRNRPYVTRYGRVVRRPNYYPA